MNEMKYTLATALLAAASLMAPTGVSAQARQQATIPFDFTVGERLLPAGTYVIKPVTNGVIEVHGWKGKTLLSTMTAVTPADAVGKDPNKLVFHRYGDQYFLSEIRGGLGEAVGTVIPSKLEQRVQKQRAANTNHDKTTIALK
jgi:hypothetical protein